MKNTFLEDCQKWMKENPANESVQRIERIMDLVAKRDAVELDKALERYVYRPRVRLSREGLSSTLALPQPDSHDEGVEIAAVHLLIFNAGQLRGRPVFVRDCICGKPFTATLERHRVCSSVCRQKQYDSKPENVERRKENYQIRKSKPLRGVKTSAVNRKPSKLKKK